MPGRRHQCRAASRNCSDKRCTRVTRAQRGARPRVPRRTSRDARAARCAPPRAGRLAGGSNGGPSCRRARRARRSSEPRAVVAGVAARPTCRAAFTRGATARFSAETFGLPSRCRPPAAHAGTPRATRIACRWRTTCLTNRACGRRCTGAVRRDRRRRFRVGMTAAVCGVSLESASENLRERVDGA